MIKLTEAEWQVLGALWTYPNATLGDVVTALAPARKWQRNTVHTYLTRMEGKGLVTIDRTTEPHRYAASVTREECAQAERRSLLDKVYGGAAGDLIAAFLKESAITPEERDRLRSLLDDMEV